MATEIVGSLFGVTPEMFQQRQAEMADRQALEYAQLSPLQRASFNIARGGYQLAGALGGQDPQLQMISRRQAIARQIDPTNLNSIQMGIQALAQAGDQVGAMQLSQVLRQAENDIALRSQREASATASLAAATRERSQAVPASIQEANRISQITQTLQNPELSPYERMGLEAEMQQLRKTSTTETQTPEIRNAAALASLKGVPGSPEYAQEFQSQLSRLTAKTEVREPTTNEITNARAVALQAGPVGSPEYNAAFNAEYNRLTAPKEAREPTTNEITNARAVAAQAGPVGSPEYIAAFREEYNRLTAPKESREPTTSELTNARAIALRAGPEGSPEYNAEFQSQLARLTAKAEGREATTPEITNASALALRVGPVGSPEYLAEFNTQLARLTTKTPAETKTEIQRLQEYASSLPVGSTARAQVEAKIKALGQGGTTIQNILPGQAVPRKDWMDFTQNVLSKDPVMLRTSTIISDAPAAIDIIRTSTENDISAAALPGALARLTGEGKNMSNEDVRRFARTGGLDDRIAQDVVKFFTGRTTTVKKDQAEKFATALYRGALIERRKKLVDEADQYGYLESQNYKTALRQIDDQLKQTPAPGTKSGSVPTPAVTGGRVTPSDQALLDKYAPRKP